MAIELSKEESEQAVASVRKYFKEEFDEDISEMRARFLLNYFLKEIAPLAYNRGVRDAETFLRSRIEDVSGTCFEAEFTYWQQKKFARGKKSA